MKKRLRRLLILTPFLLGSCCCVQPYPRYYILSEAIEEKAIKQEVSMLPPSQPERETSNSSSPSDP